MKKQKFQPNFLVNESGKPIAVQLDIKSYKALLEEVEDKIDIKRAEKKLTKKGKTHTLEEMVGL
ncbi:MAG: hypothetical protein ABIA74_01440 [bacterium]